MSLQALWHQALLDPNQALPSGLKTWNGSDPAQRMAIHRNNVVVSLLDALACTFVVTQQLVGEEFFRAMAQIYVRRCPPRSPVLSRYGHDFPDFVCSFAPAASVPYLSDVARLEFLRVLALHAADAQPASTDQIQSQLKGADDCVLTLAPCLQSLTSVRAAVSIWAAHDPDSGLMLEHIDLERVEYAWIFRDGWDVQVLQVNQASALMVEYLGAGLRLGQAVTQVNEAAPDWDVIQTLALLFQHGLVTAIQPA